MKHILFLLFFLPVLAFAQYQPSPTKLRLGVQTTGDGLIYRSGASPNYVPATQNNAFFHFDTIAKKLYFFQGGMWQQFTSGGGGSGTVTSITAVTGLTGGTITTSGTIAADTATLATAYALQDTAAAIRADFPTGGIYGGSGALPGNVTVDMGENNVLRLEATGFAGTQLALLELNDATLFETAEPAITFLKSGVEKMRFSAGGSFFIQPYISTVTAGSELTIFSDNDIVTSPINNYSLFTKLPNQRPLTANSFWRHNNDGTGQFIDANTLMGGAPVTKTGNFTVGASESWLIVNNASANTTVTLPTASSNSGRKLVIKNLSASFTVISASSNVVPINSATAGTAILPATAGAWATLVSDGTSWVIMQQ